MRNGILWAAGLVLASISPAIAQEKANPVMKEAPVTVIAVSLQPPAGVTQGPAATETITYFDAQPEGSRGFWVGADYLLWWIKRGPVTSPIVTTSSNFADQPPGGLNQPGTRVLFGDEPVGYGTFSGLRINAGFVSESGLTLEANYFVLERRSNHFSVSSDANGSPLIGISFFNTAIGIEDALLTANPDAARGIWTGTASVVSRTRLQGWELNVAGQGQRGDSWSLKPIIGVRAMYLNESMSIANEFTPLIDGVLTFAGPTVLAGTRLSDVDHFRTNNQFYGGQVGGRLEWQSGALSMNVLGKIALGATQQIVEIDGSSSMVTTGGVSTTVPGGIYAQASNIGRYNHTAFAVVPEIGVSLGYAITSRLTASVGYSFLYWSRVARPGDQIDHGVHEAQIPTHQFFNTSTPDGRPAYSQRQTDFFAHGLNFGLSFVY